MQRVDTSTAVVELPAQNPAGTPGYFSQGNPSIGLPATVPGQDWFNIVQEELMAIILAAGLTPDKTTTNQVLQAIKQLCQYASDTGSADAYAIALSPALTSHVSGMPISFKAANANTGAATLNVDGLGAVAIKKNVNKDLSAGDIAAGQIIIVVYDGTYFQMISWPGAGALDSLTGMVMACPFSTVPAGWLECNGAAVSRTTYAGLYAKIGVTYGSGDGSTTFNLPDYRGRFLRGWDHGAGVDPDAASRTDRGDTTTGDYVGTKQTDEFKSHNHDQHADVGVMGIGSSSGYYCLKADGTWAMEPAKGGNETRPVNINVMYCIKY